MHELWASDLAPLIFVALFAAMAWLGYPIAQALRRRIEGKTASAEEVVALREHMAELRDRLDSATGFADRLMELEERVDFAERVLTRGDEAAADLPPRVPERT